MAGWEFRTPVAMLIFNRPETTARVFERVREARPPKLLVVADGPRADRPGEAGRCREARAVVEAVDWPCELMTDYSEANLGCGERISSGLDWVFDSVEEAIVLEDDCLPHPSFFRFCEELLKRYRAEERVMHVSGDNFQSAGRAGGAVGRLLRLAGRSWSPSYYFSRYAHVWGWACMAACLERLRLRDDGVAGRGRFRSRDGSTIRPSGNSGAARGTRSSAARSTPGTISGP